MFCAISCSGPEAPEFLRLTKTIVQVDASNSINISTEAVYHNPNPFGSTMEAYDISSFLEDIFVSRISREKSMEIPANSDFVVPVQTSMKREDIEAAQAELTKLVRKALVDKIEVRYKGSITFSLSGIRLKVPIDQADDVEVRLNLL